MILDIFKTKPSNSNELKKKLEKHSCDFYDLYTPELLEWIGVTNDPVLLSCAYHLINIFDWPAYLPKAKPEFNIDNHGWNADIEDDYKSIFFTDNLMKQLNDKAELLSPGLSKCLWMTGYYKKYSTK